MVSNLNRSNEVFLFENNAQNSFENLFNEITKQSKDYYPNFLEIESLLDSCMRIENSSRLKKTIDQFELLEEKRKGDDYKSLLFSAIQANKESLALKLIQLKVLSINSKNNSYKETPLHVAVENGLPEIVQSLLDYGAEINTTTHHRDNLQQATALTKCARIGASYEYAHSSEKKEKFDKIFQILMNCAADPKIGWDLCKPTFHWIIESNNQNWIDQTVNKVDINCKQRHTQKTALHVATAMGNTRLVEKLKELGAEDSFAFEGLYSERKITPLHTSVLFNRPKIAEVFLKHGADVNERATNPYYGSSNKYLAEGEPLTPFQEAVDLGCTEIVKLMVNSSSELVKDLPIKRTMFDPRRYQKGYLSLGTRIETEIVKNKHQLKLNISPFRVYTANPAQEKQLQSIFDNDLVSKQSISEALFLCKPILEALEIMSKKNPNLSICFVKSKEYQGCFNFDTGEEIILSVELVDSAKIIPIVIHEATHKAAHAFLNGRNCAPSDGSDFYQALEKDLTQVKDDYSEIRNLWSTIKEGYEKQHWSAEYLARIPQAAAMMAIKNPKLKQAEIEEMLKESIPHTYAYFKNDFIPRCEKFIKENS